MDPTRPLRLAAVRAVLAVALAAPALAAARADQPDFRATSYSARTNYVLRCSGCHGLAGAGAARAGVPDFRGLVGSFAGDKDGRTYVARVPGVRNAHLDPKRTADVLNYVMATFAGPSLKPGVTPFSEAEVAAAQALPPSDIVALRRAVAARLKAEGAPVADYPWP